MRRLSLWTTVHGSFNSAVTPWVPTACPREMLKTLLNDQAWAPTDLQGQMLDERRQGPGAPAGPASPNGGVRRGSGAGQCHLETEGLGGAPAAQGNSP